MTSTDSAMKTVLTAPNTASPRVRRSLFEGWTAMPVISHTFLSARKPYQSEFSPILRDTAFTVTSKIRFTTELKRPMAVEKLYCALTSPVLYT